MKATQPGETTPPLFAQFSDPTCPKCPQLPKLMTHSPPRAGRGRFRVSTNRETLAWVPGSFPCSSTSSHGVSVMTLVSMSPSDGGTTKRRLGFPDQGQM